MTFESNSKRLSLIAVSIVAPLLWSAGIVAGLFGWIQTGVWLRCIALVLAASSAGLRPTLLIWALFSMGVGVELGMDAPKLAIQTQFIGDLFLRLIKMIVAPLLLATIATGIAGHGQLRSVVRVAVKALLYFEVITSLGLLIGALAMNFSGAGWGVKLPLEQTMPVVNTDHTWQQTLVNLFPENIAQAVAQNQILQIATFAILFGIALAMLPQHRKEPLLVVLRSIADTTFQMTRIIMLLVPVAAGAALAAGIGHAGLAALWPLAKLVLCYNLALIVFLLAVQLPTLFLFRIPIKKFIFAIAEPTAIGFATTTSESVFPLCVDRLEEYGMPRWVASFVLSTGYSFNMTGSSIYLSMAAIFCTQVGGIHLTVAHQIAILLTLMLASKGMAGVPRMVLVILMATAHAMQIPTAPILLLLGADSLMDMGRAATNVIGNCTAVVLIAKSETREDELQPA